MPKGTRRALLTVTGNGNHFIPRHWHKLFYGDPLSRRVLATSRGCESIEAIIYAQPGRKKIRYRIMCSFPIALSASLSRTEDPLGL